MDRRFGRNYKYVLNQYNIGWIFEGAMKGAIAMKDKKVDWSKAGLLIVDDDPGIQETLSDIFQEKGYRVATAGTGREALDEAKETAFDAALIDIKLPDMDGAALLKEFKKGYPKMVYCIITGHASIQNAVAALKDGASGYFVKPLVIDEVVHRVEETLDKQHLERELRESVEKYSTLVEKGNDGIVIIQDGLLKFANAKMVELTDFTMEKAIRKSFIDFVSPEYRGLVIDRYKKRIAGEEVPNRYEIEILSKDGRKIPVEINATMIKYKGRPADMAIIRNITERKRTEEALRASEARLRTIIDSEPECVKLVALDGTLLEMNPAGLAMIGAKSSEQVCGKSVYDLILSEDLDRFRTLHESATRGVAGKAEFRIVGLDNKERYMESHSVPWRDVDGNIVAVLSVTRDISERKRAKEELLLLQKINNMLNAGVGQEEVFRTIVDGLQSLYNYDSVAIHLLSKDQRHLIIKNYSADSKTTKKLEKLIGLTVRGYTAPLYEGSLLKKVVDTKKPVITDDIGRVLKSYTDRKSLQNMAKAAARLTEARWGMGAPLLAGDKVVGVIGCGNKEKLTDADAERFIVFSAQAGLAIERAQTYEELGAAYEELKHSNQLKDLFIDIMTHDMLNPAGAARNMAKMVLEDEKDPNKKEPLQVILRSNKRIIDMIENAFTLAKLESGEELEFKEVDLGVILKSVATEMTPLADEKNMKIKIPTKREFKALVNPLIHDVFSNLLSNAIKYGPEKSEVVVEIEEDNSNWKISITDNGPGIPDEHKEAVFDRFKRIQKGPVKGSGLGLAIVKRVVEAHKSRVWVENNPKGGSIFFVLLKKG